MQTYMSCYEEGGELNRHTEYQILNSTGVSSLQWPQCNGIYMFAVTVVARDYRYWLCVVRPVFVTIFPNLQFLSLNHSLCCKSLWSFWCCHLGIHSTGAYLPYWNGCTHLLLLRVQAAKAKVKIGNIP